MLVFKDETDKKIFELWKEGYSDSKISGIINFSITGVFKRRKRLGLSPNYIHVPKKISDEQLIRAKESGVPIREISKIFNVNERTVMRRLSALGY